MRKFVILGTLLAFLFVVGSANAAVTSLKAGESTNCVNAGWVVTNQSEEQDTVITFDVGPIGYGWGKTAARTLAPGGYQANALARKTVFHNKGPGTVSVNCQRRATDFFHDWKIDAGSSKTYQADYHSDHVTPGTYIEPGMGLPVGTERGIFGGAGTGDGGGTGERYR